MEKIINQVKSILVFAGIIVFFQACITQPEIVEEFPEQEVVESQSVLQIKEEDPIPESKIEVVPEAKKEPEVKEDPENEVIAEFGSVIITKKDYIATKTEIQIVVENLNKITASKDYGKWLKYLSEDYKKVFSTPSMLKTISDNLPIKGIRLKNLYDYFVYVFVPSRQRIKVDDIHFESPTEVNVLTKIGNKVLLVYNLEKINDNWFLIPKD